MSFYAVLGNYMKVIKTIVVRKSWNWSKKKKTTGSLPV